MKNIKQIAMISFLAWASSIVAMENNEESLPTIQKMEQILHQELQTHSDNLKALEDKGKEIEDLDRLILELQKKRVELKKEQEIMYKDNWLRNPKVCQGLENRANQLRESLNRLKTLEAK